MMVRLSPLANSSLNSSLRVLAVVTEMLVGDSSTALSGGTVAGTDTGNAWAEELVEVLCRAVSADSK